MKFLGWVFLAGLPGLMFLSSCDFREEKVAEATLEAKYSAIQEKVIQASCVSCHGGTSPSDGKDFTTYGTLIASGAVVPSNPAGSSFLTQVKAGTMPPSGKLPQAYIDAIEQWITNGANND